MNRFLASIGRVGWRLLGAAAGIYVLFLALTMTPADHGSGYLTPQQALAVSQQDARLLIDIRTPAEWRETGIAPNAALADYNGLGRGGGFIARVNALVDGDKASPIALICARGGRSSRAARLLRAAGFEDVRDVHEGMIGNMDGPGWLARGLPTVPWRPAG
ncbi:MAG: hypothetical protein Tsb0016_01010 [Sphingomonadales bacterium]